MNYVIDNMRPFRVIGYARYFDSMHCQSLIPFFWQEVFNPKDKLQRSLNIGEFGVCMDDPDRVKYVIGGFYKGSEVPEGMEVVDIPGGAWAKFECRGPVPEAIQKMTDYIYGEWLPYNTEYELASEYMIEWYAPGITNTKDYHSEVWINVKEKGN